MILSDVDIAAEYASTRLGITPYDPRCIQPASYDVHLSSDFIEPLGNDRTRRYDGTDIVLEPMQFLLGSTIETLSIPSHIVARVEGKSSLARIGLMVHITAGFVDPGFIGNVTLELLNVSRAPVTLVAGMKIAQISFHRLETPCARPYGSPGLMSKYQHSVGTVSSQHTAIKVKP